MADREVIQIHELDKSNPKDLDLVLISQDGNTRTCTIEDIRNIAATIDEGGYLKSASNGNLKDLKTNLKNLENNYNDSNELFRQHMDDNSIHMREDLTQLTTSNKSSLVDAVNEVNQDTGVAEGTYSKVTVNKKGKVVLGQQLDASDIPQLTLSKISDVGTVASKNTGNASGDIPILNSNGKLDENIIPTISKNFYGIAEGINSYATTINGVDSYFEGLVVCVKIENDSTGESTLNINNLGVINILDSTGTPITAGELKANIPYNLCYNGTNFIVLGKGGESVGGENATPEQLVEGATATTDSGQIVGTMSRRTEFMITDTIGSDSGYPNDVFKFGLVSIDPIGLCASINIQLEKNEYISGNFTIYIQNLSSRYIKSGVKVGGENGITGTYSGN